MEGDSWLTGSLLDFVAFHFAQHFPDVHYLPTNFAVVDLPNAVRNPETLSVSLACIHVLLIPVNFALMCCVRACTQSFDARDILGRKVTLRPDNVDAMIETVRSETVEPPTPAPEPVAPPPIPALPSLPPPAAASTDTPSSAGTSIAASAGSSGGDASSSVLLATGGVPQKRNPLAGTCARTRPLMRVSHAPVRVVPIPLPHPSGYVSAMPPHVPMPVPLPLPGLGLGRTPIPYDPR